MLFTLIWTLGPLVCALIFLGLWLDGQTSAKVAGVVIQGLTAAPLAFAFRQRLSKLLHDATDWVHGHGPGKEKTRLYRLFIWVGGRGNRQTNERALTSVLELIGLVSLIGYFVGGLVLQNFADGNAISNSP